MIISASSRNRVHKEHVDYCKGKDAMRKSRE